VGRGGEGREEGRGVRLGEREGRGEDGRGGRESGGEEGAALGGLRHCC